jgi:2-(1,2-epoxy-1,2-dihydrophenyl)acetyl-CoA isomerase
MTFTAIRMAVVEGVATITLARPDKLNAFTAVMHAELREALTAAEADETVRCVVLTGEGRAFSAGQDLSEERIRGADGAVDFGARLERDYNPLVERLYAFPKVTIAALNGPTAGAAANVALACDILLAARSATFVQAFARIGLVPDCGGTWLLPRLVGTARARALAFLAEPLPAETAAEWGLVWRMTEDERLLPEAEALAARLASQASNALALTKRALDATGENTLAQQLDLEGELQRQAGAHPDHAEGVRAFLEKRPAAFAKTRN